MLDRLRGDVASPAHRATLVLLVLERLAVISAVASVQAGCDPYAPDGAVAVRISGRQDFGVWSRWSLSAFCRESFRISAL